MEKKEATNKAELFARNALKASGIIRHDGEHELLDISLLRETSDRELAMMRTVGRSAIGKIRELRATLEWL